MKKYVQMNAVDIKVHNEIMGMYSSDEQNQRMDDDVVSYETDEYGCRIYTD